ncbi:hypothetical protein F5X71_34560 [Nocardia brasiliensis]|uniref:Uncharacterized protein n=1 Tax=Nocardia brasiliensis TaxID=37326 RepID=A0A6G9Y0V8_NOCBR|nr:hypothetical protein [Nocardia brasiliensis]QIS06750.1 hypothetical protein F5X71_34560 [Nocardia brasiliensis]
MTDKLAHVKQFFVGVVLDGFGQRKFTGIEGLSVDLLYIHNKVVPALYDAIKSDDPAYDPHNEIVHGAAGTEATGTGAVRWFVELLEADRAFQGLKDETCELYVRMYKSCAQNGCFLDGLRAALRADDPAWRAHP